MKLWRLKRKIGLALTTIFFCSIPFAAQTQLAYQLLPKEIRDLASEVRNSCKELEPTKHYDDMQGISVLNLKGDSSRAIFVDHEGLCGEHIARANCSNRGCDLLVYIEAGRAQWRKIFQEHLYGKYLAVDWEHMRLQLMVVTIYAGDPRCRPDPKKEYTTGKSCNLLVTYRNDRWSWQLIK
jgi:hypothetical protein